MLALNRLDWVTQYYAEPATYCLPPAKISRAGLNNFKHVPVRVMASLKEILVIGGTGAQGTPVVKGKRHTSIDPETTLTYQIACSSCSERQVFCQGADPES